MRQALEDGVAARLGYDPFVERAERRVDVLIQGREGAPGYRARVSLQRAGGSDEGLRELESESQDCGELVDALVFAVVVAIEPSRGLGQSRAGGPAAERRAVMGALLRVHDARSVGRAEAVRTRRRRATSPPDSEADGSGDEEDVGRPLDVRASLGGGLSVGLAPEPAGLVQIHGEVARPRWSVALGGAFGMPVRSDSGLERGGRFETSVALAELNGCGRFLPLFVCGVGAVGALRTTGIELPESASNSHLYAALGARGGVEFGVTDGVALRLHGQLLGTLARTRVIVGDEALWRTPDLSAVAGAAVVFEMF